MLAQAALTCMDLTSLKVTELQTQMAASSRACCGHVGVCLVCAVLQYAWRKQRSPPSM